MKGLLKNKAFLFAIIFYLLGVLAYSSVEFYESRNSAVKEIDAKLLSAVSSAENILFERLKDKIIGDGLLTPDEDFFIALELQELAQSIPVTYIYSVIKRGNNILFTSSNPSAKEVVSKDYSAYETVYLTSYDDAPVAIYNTFLKEIKHYSNYTDQWGQFRSLFFPLKHTNGETYVIGIDIDASYVVAAAYRSFFKALIYGLLLGVIAAPLICVALRGIKREYQLKIEALYVDAVTGLPNKRRLESILSKHNYAELQQHLLLIEVENFTQVSTAIGVTSTDQLMVQLAHSISDTNTEYFELYTVFHCADDLFAVYSTYDFSPSQLSKMTSDIFTSLVNRPVFEEGRDNVPIVIRMGAVSNYPDPLTLASLSLMHAKQNNLSIVLYEPSLKLSERSQRYIEVFSLFTDAVKYNRVKVFYQPIIDVATGQVEKYEALARITDQAGELVSSPDEFMPIAYQSSLCHKLTRVMIDKVIADVKDTDHIVSLNLSVKDLFDKRTREYIVQQVRKAKVGHQIDLELLEQQVITDYRLAAAHIKRLKGSVRFVGMDDLGKHYSNFDRLLSLPLDFLKIDGIIVEAIERDDSAHIIVEGIVKFARKKNIRVVAEHCSSESVCEIMREMQVDFLQGFYLGMPSEGFNVKTYKNAHENNSDK